MRTRKDPLPGFLLIMSSGAIALALIIRDGAPLLLFIGLFFVVMFRNRMDRNPK